METNCIAPISITDKNPRKAVIGIDDKLKNVNTPFFKMLRSTYLYRY